ncbi:MAG TPA: hypothetical protein DCE08_02145 [Ruminococcaceae bacterium]|nr:hypothetical protein [Oscillospiraceae bacterium]
MEEKETNRGSDKVHGGLYAKVKMSVRSANILVAVLCAALIITTVFVVRHGGFTVTFDTDGGSAVESVRLKYSETIPSIDSPVKEGYRFSGWYTDRSFTRQWREEDPVVGSMTLYAKWEK